MPTLPPIPQDTWDEHVTAQTDAAVQDGFSAIDQARQAQDAARQAEQIATAREQEESYQSAQTQLQSVLAPAKDAQSRVQVAEQTRSQLDSILAPARAAQQQAQQATARPSEGSPTSGAASAPSPTDVQGTDWRAYAAQAAQKAGIDPALFQRQIQQESGFDPNARSGAGALGIAQIVPSAHPGVDPLDPKAALDYAATWMRQLTDRYGGDVRKALAAYNAGPGAVDQYGGVPPFEETQRYVKTIYDDAGGAAGQTPATVPPVAPGAESSQFARARSGSPVEALGQFEQGLPYDEAAAICGPVAALAFAQSQGRNPDLAEARALAKQVGWTSTGGMNGVANEQALLTRLGVKSRLDTNPDFGVIAHDASSGNPVIISTPVHYYYASGYDPATGKVFVGKTGTSRKGGGSWMTPQEIATLDGGINGALFVDNPQSPNPSVGADPMASGEDDRPASEFEPPSRFAETDQDYSGNIPRRLGPASIAPTDLSRIGIDVPVPGPSEIRSAALTSANAVGAGIDWAGQGLVDNVQKFRADQEELARLSLDRARAAHRGETLPPDQEQRLTDLSMSYGLPLTGEPLAAANQAGRAALGLERAATARQPGMSLEEVGGAAKGMSDEAYAVFKAAMGRGDYAEAYRLIDAARSPTGPLPEAVGPSAAPTGPTRQLPLPGLDEPPPRIPNVPHPEFLQPEAALPARTVPIVRQAYDRVRNVVASMGESGQDLAGRIHAWREGAETDAAAYLDRMPGVKQLGKSDFVNLVDVLEGNATPKSIQVERAAAEAKGVLDDLYSRAQNAGVDVAERIENYFPHVYKDATIRSRLDTARRGELIKRVMDAGNADTTEEANAVVHRWIQGGERDRRQGNLEMARLANLPGYEKTKEALYNHVLTATRRLHEVAQFGRDDAIANRLIDRIGAEGYPIALARDLFQSAVGAHTYPEQLQTLSRIARAYHTITRLGWAVLGNATQPVNTASVAGVVRTMAASAKAAFNPAERRFADLTGSTLDSVIKEVREGGGWSDRVTGKAMLGFGEVEKWNRRLTAIAGRDFARDMAARAAGTASGLNRIGTQGGARRALERLGLDADAIVKRGGKLTPDEEISAARNIVERTQFRTDPQDIPEWASHPLGRMVFQFKAFPYAQTAFIKRDLIDEARKGNVAPLVRFAILAPLAQAAATETRNLVQGRDPEEDPGMRAVQYALGPLGLVGDVSRTVFGINSKYVPAERRASMLVGSMLGPTAGTLTEAAVAGLNASDILFHPDPEKVDQRLTPGLRMALRQLPYVGGLAANKITPYKSQEPAAPPPSPSRNRSGTRDTRERSRSGGR